MVEKGFTRVEHLSRLLNRPQPTVEQYSHHWVVFDNDYGGCFHSWHGTSRLVGRTDFQSVLPTAVDRHRSEERATSDFIAEVIKVIPQRPVPELVGVERQVDGGRVCADGRRRFRDDESFNNRPSRDQIKLVRSIVGQVSALSRQRDSSQERDLVLIDGFRVEPCYDKSITTI